jgi:transcriptional regulator with PAS, ATPase and Fis domain
MDFARIQNLHTIIMLKDVIRKWWQSELCFADRTGQVLDWRQQDSIVPPPNDFCRLSLFSKEGFRRCTQSVRVLHEKFKGSKKLRGALFHDCHLNFTIVGAPIYVNNEYEGFLFVEGFARQAMTEGEAQVLKHKISELNPGATDLARALKRVHVMPPYEVDKLKDLLEFGSTEITNYETDSAKKDETIQTLSAELHELYQFENIVGAVPQMQEVISLVEKVRNADTPLLVVGEPGTGKELISKVVHFSGTRKERPFFAQSCSALDEATLESTLFGHVRGAFTGALTDKKGLFEVGDGGTFFLDDIGALPSGLQLKLLRFLQDGTFTPVGGTQPKEASVRVVAGTRQDLRELVKQGRFREDLYFRINVIRLALPPLRERKADLPLLVDHFLRRRQREGQRVRGLSLEAQRMFDAYDWPGNIRELENELERLLVLAADAEYVSGSLVSPRIQEALGLAPARVLPGLGSAAKLNDAVEALEKEMIAQGLARTGYNKSRLSRELGISRSNLILKIAKYELARPGEDEDDDEAAEA